MSKYRVAVRETRQMDITVEAETLEEAIADVWRHYSGGNIEFGPEDTRLTEVIPTGRIEELRAPATHRVIDLTTGEIHLIGTYEECLKFVDEMHDYNITVTE